MIVQSVLNSVLQDNKQREIIQISPSGAISFKEFHGDKETLKLLTFELSDNNAREIYDVYFHLTINDAESAQAVPQKSLADTIQYDQEFTQDLNNALNTEQQTFRTKRILEFHDLTIEAFYQKVLQESEFNEDTLIDLTEIDNPATTPSRSVQKIYWGHRDVTELRDLYRYRNLHNLSIWGCTGTNALTKEVAKLQNLAVLSLSDMIALPEEFIDHIHTLSSLISLTINRSKYNASDHHFQLERLPAHMEKLSSLTYLNLDGNGLSDFSQLAPLTHLKTLSLWNNSFSNVNGIENLQRLEALNLSNNKLEHLPASLLHLTKIKILDLRKNPLKEIPEWLCEMEQLEELYLDQTQLKTLPDNIANLKKLRVLSLKKNPFETLPKSLSKIPKKVLNLELHNMALFDKKAKAKLAQYPNINCLFESDINFKLMVIQKLMYEDETLLPKFNIYDFAKEHNIDIEKDGYSVIPEALHFFKTLPIPMKLLIDIEELQPDGGDEIYAQVIPYWDGEDETFHVRSIKDIHCLPNLKRTNDMTFNNALKKELRHHKIKVSSY